MKSWGAAVTGVVLGMGWIVAPAIAPPPGPAVVTPGIHSAAVSGSGVVAAGWQATVRSPANLVGVRWDGDPDARFRVEAQNRSGTWQAITDVGFESEHQPDPGTLEAERAATRPASDAVWVGDAAAVRVRLTSGTARDVTVERVMSPPASPRSGVASAATVAMPGIVSRGEWGADENLRLANCPEPPDISTNTTVGVVHHTGGNNNYGPQDTPAIVRGLYGYATQTLKYCDTHYNFFVDRYGQIFEGRYGSVWDPVRAAHTTGMNTGTVGVALIGNFQNVPPPAAAIDALERLLAWKLNLHGVDPRRSVDYTPLSNTDRWPAGVTRTIPYIVGHRDPGSTDCPGNFVYSQLPKIRLAVAGRILSGQADVVSNHAISGSAPKLAVASSYGVVYPAGGAPELRAAAVWPNWSIARDIELSDWSPGGWTLDGFGGVHPFQGAPSLGAGPYWPGFAIARDLVVRPGGGGWILDGLGAVHAFGGAPSLGRGPYWPGFDIARKLVRFSAGWYVMDAYGALHPLGNAPPVYGPYWPGWQIARDVAANPDGPGGYILDGYGGVTPVGGAPRVSGVPYFGRDVARGFVVLPGGRGYTVREDGYLARFGGAPTVSQSRNTWRNAAPITTPWVVIGVAAA